MLIFWILDTSIIYQTYIEQTYNSVEFHNQAAEVAIDSKKINVVEEQLKYSSK